LLAGLAVLVVVAAAGGVGAWQYVQNREPAPGEPRRPAAAARQYKYVALDKVLVMLRGRPGEPMSHYLSVDLVFRTPPEQEKITREHLALLRSVAVRSLSEYTFESAGMMTIDQYTAAINRAYSESYAREQLEKPFADVMIGKLIIE
jgi:flagellar FliL protein